MVFVRAPEPGRVKTRLARGVGEAKALELYRLFVSKTLATARDWAERPGCNRLRREVWICYTPEDRADMVKDWLGREHTFLAQTGAGLGRRMARAMETAFDRGAAKVLLVGSDIPDMRVNHLETASNALSKTDLVLGPTLDGGYWLVGATGPGFSRQIFKEMPWGTDQVFARTLRQCKRLNLTRTALSPLRDVDTKTDLEATRFFKTLPTDFFAG